MAVGMLWHRFQNACDCRGMDATVIRGLLVPAFMRVMGRANWWAPRWVQRLVARVGLYEGDVTTGGPRPDPTPEPA